MNEPSWCEWCHDFTELSTYKPTGERLCEKCLTEAKVSE